MDRPKGHARIGLRVAAVKVSHARPFLALERAVERDLWAGGLAIHDFKRRDYLTPSHSTPAQSSPRTISWAASGAPDPTRPMNRRHGRDWGGRRGQKKGREGKRCGLQGWRGGLILAQLRGFPHNGGCVVANSTANSERKRRKCRTYP